ncbi:MAG: hypothetical protein VZR09_10565 [Candidatus Gastranaerophilaceae bacterium]|nr:hypothetical protein [Candidatus Gastranaerophilaceae bacterium]
MGMSASQARFLSLTARKNNVEFEGQQINQQRTTLSNESASYYSELCNMEVPTPPSIDDYTKVSYTFNDGAMTNTLISLLPDTTQDGRDKNRYYVNYVEEWQDDYAIVPATSSLVQVNDPENPTAFTIGSSQLRKIDNLTDAEIDAKSADDIDRILQNDDYAKELTLEQKRAMLKNEVYLLKMVQDKTADNGDFYIRYVKNTTTGNYEPYLYANSELTQGEKYNNKNLGSIPCFSLGSTRQTREVLHQEATVEKDTSGRYIAITIKLDKNNSRTYPLTTTTTTDEEAYNDAMNQYNYKQHEYDHKIQEINSKLEIVQQQDKQLELKLKQLDTEENAISTEMDAVKKVISKNVESSFKTFNA